MSYCEDPNECPMTLGQRYHLEFEDPCYICCCSSVDWPEGSVHDPEICSCSKDTP